VYPATSEGIQNYLKSIGLENIEANDAEEAKVNWDKQKEKVKEASEYITISFLKERREVMAVLQASYEKVVLKYEEELKDHVRLADSNNAPIPEKKRIINLVEKIKKHLPVNPKYSDAYRTKKGKWDIPMLANTSYAKLLEIFSDIRKA
jgi:hypothetical protein